MMNERRGELGWVEEDVGFVGDARVGGAEGQAPGAGRALKQRRASAGEAAAKLFGVARETWADHLPRGGEFALDVVHGGDCTEYVRGEARQFFAPVLAGV